MYQTKNNNLLSSSAHRLPTDVARQRVAGRALQGRYRDASAFPVLYINALKSVAQLAPTFAIRPLVCFQPYGSPWAPSQTSKLVSVNVLSFLQRSLLAVTYTKHCAVVTDDHYLKAYGRLAKKLV